MTKRKLLCQRCDLYLKSFVVKTRFFLRKLGQPLGCTCNQDILFFLLSVGLNPQPFNAVAMVSIVFLTASRRSLVVLELTKAPLYVHMYTSLSWTLLKFGHPLKIVHSSKLDPS